MEAIKDYYDKNDYDEHGDPIKKEIQIIESKNNLTLKFCKNSELN